MLRVRCKKCGVELTSTNKTQACGCPNQMELIEGKITAVDLSQAVSYTHLTLPTTPYV